MVQSKAGSGEVFARELLTWIGKAVAIEREYTFGNPIQTMQNLAENHNSVALKDHCVHENLYLIFDTELKLRKMV